MADFPPPPKSWFTVNQKLEEFPFLCRKKVSLENVNCRPLHFLSTFQSKTFHYFCLLHTRHIGRPSAYTKHWKQIMLIISLFFIWKRIQKIFNEKYNFRCCCISVAKFFQSNSLINIYSTSLFLSFSLHR